MYDVHSKMFWTKVITITHTVTIPKPKFPPEWSVLCFVSEDRGFKDRPRDRLSSQKIIEAFLGPLMRVLWYYPNTAYNCCIHQYSHIQGRIYQVDVTNKPACYKMLRCKEQECASWTYLAQDSNQWRALVDIVMNLLVVKKGWVISCPHKYFTLLRSVYILTWDFYTFNIWLSWCTVSSTSTNPSLLCTVYIVHFPHLISLFTRPHISLYSLHSVMWGSNPISRTITRQWLCKHVSLAKDMHTQQYKSCWKRCFLLGSPGGYICRTETDEVSRVGSGYQSVDEAEANVNQRQSAKTNGSQTRIGVNGQELWSWRIEFWDGHRPVRTWTRKLNNLHRCESLPSNDYRSHSRLKTYCVLWRIVKV
jgi:hypothetical protein